MIRSLSYRARIHHALGQPAAVDADLRKLKDTLDAQAAEELATIDNTDDDDDDDVGAATPGAEAIAPAGAEL